MSVPTVASFPNSASPAFSRKRADDMSAKGWSGLVGGLLEFFAEEAKEPEHVAKDAEFKESDHPRKDDGKFGKGGGGSKNKTVFKNTNSPLDTKVRSAVLNKNGSVDLLKSWLTPELTSILEKEFGSVEDAYNAAKDFFAEKKRLDKEKKAVAKSQVAKEPVFRTTPPPSKSESESSGGESERWMSEGPVVSDLRKSVPELKHLNVRASKYDKDVIYLSASTEVNSKGTPVTLPGDKSATGIALKINPKTKHVYFSELNSHIKGAGKRMVESVIKNSPGYKFSVTDWSNISKGEESQGPSFWDKVKQAHPTKFAGDAKIHRAAGLILQTPDDCALFLKRSETGDHKGEWCWPGGGIEGDEKPVDAALREVREETGWIREEEKLEQVDQSDGDVEFTTFKVKVNNPFIPMLDDEHIGWAWAPLSDPPQPLHPGCVATLDKVGLAQDEGEFKESDHPRKDDGKFGSGSSKESKIEITSNFSDLGKYNSATPEQGSERIKDIPFPGDTHIGEVLDAAKAVDPDWRYLLTDPKTEDVDRDNIVAMQPFADPKIVEKYKKELAAGEKQKAPLGIKYKGRVYLANGTHRTLAALASGAKTLPIRLINNGQDVSEKKAQDVAANEATKSELKSEIKFPPDKATGGTRAINIEMKNGGVGKKLKYAPGVEEYTRTGLSNDQSIQWFALERAIRSTKDVGLVLAVDEANRMFDLDGRMHVRQTNLSKSNICDYLGNEIPDYQKLGLDPNKIYKLLRDPDELRKAAPTFNGIQLLMRHVPVSAEDHQPWDVVGTTGTDAVFEEPYLKNSLIVWVQRAIDAVESEDMVELSAGYHYRPDPSPGIYKGQRFDIVMRDIIGNHMSLVREGRTGKDIRVGDTLVNLQWHAIERALTVT